MEATERGVWRTPAAWLLGWLAIALAVAAVAHAGPVGARGGLLLGGWVAGGAVWALCTVRALRGARVRLAAVLVGAVVLRLVALAGAPGLSDDLNRYAWEGALLLEGRSPYAHAPSDPELAHLRERWPELHAGINHPDVPAAYPPLTQLACSAVVLVCGGPERALLGLRVLFALADLAVLVPLLVLARGRVPRAAAAIAWGWSPLVCLEFAGSGHFDSLGILLLMGGIALVGGGPVEARARGGPRDMAGTALCAAGALVKLLPLAALPFVLRGPRAVRRALVAGAVLALGAVPVLLAGEGGGAPWQGLAAYGLRWEGGSLVFRFVEPLFEGLGERDGGLTDPRLLARAAVGLAWLGIGALAVRRGAGPLAGAGVLIGAFVVLTPTLHPWYLCWCVPFVALRPSAAWLALLALAPLLYGPLVEVAAGRGWAEPRWQWPLVALPVVALALLEGARGRLVGERG
jgi:hypothetical protein